uniref:Neuronal cell adhesion molecule n=1 Tax=Strigamia maritima TaxID=126957 RepID=T1JDB9_STRMM
AFSLSAVIPSPPTITKQPPSDYLLFQVAVNQDEKEKPFVLECEATGEPQPTYKWTKSGQPFQWQAYDARISQQQGRGTLVVTNPTDVDEGYYQCLAENEHGTALSNGVFVRKSELNSFPDEKTQTKTVNEGEPLTLECNPPTGFPKPTIFWILLARQGTFRTLNNSRITIDPEGRLHFSNVTSADAYDDQDYACSASIMFRNEYKLGNKVKLDVMSSGGSAVLKRHEPLLQYVSPPNIVTFRGDSVDLHCIFGGTPLPEIQWKKKGGKLPPGRHVFLNYGKTLQLKKVSFEDKGSYECLASNGVGAPQSRSMNVQVHARPYWVSEPNDTNAAEDEDVEFECKAAGIPEPEIKWFVNGVPLNEAPPNPRRKTVSSTMIRIEKLQKSDTAVYQCNASSTLGYVFKNFYVNVLALPPTIVEPPKAKYETVDSLFITLTCRVFGAPKPQVVWKLNGKELTGGRFNVLDSGDLEIRNVIFSDAGHYSCEAENSLGVARSDMDVGFLEVRGKQLSDSDAKRTRITAFPMDYEVPAGQSATFRCNANIDPNLSLSIDWLSNGQLIDFDQDPRMFKAADYSLTISKTSELDSGTYTCVASTRLDNATASATLIVQDIPNPPRMLGVRCDGSFANINWQPQGDNRAPIINYKIQYNTSFTPDSWEQYYDGVPATDRSFSVSMSPWANYTFRVIARNKIGDSLASEHSEPCHTPPDVPHKNPDNVVGKGTTPTNLVISWTAMQPIEHNAPEFIYRVYYRLDKPGLSWNKPIDISNWEQASYEVINQETFQPYKIKVEALNKMGQANMAAVEVIGWSGEDTPLESPHNFTLVRVVDGNTADLSWEPVHPDSVRGHFKGYKIETWLTLEGEKQMRETVVPAESSSARVEMFVPYAMNNVRMRVFNGMHEGPPTQVITFQTPEGVPGPVASFDAVPMGSNALYLMWTKPMEPNGILTGYNITYAKVEGTAVKPENKRKSLIDQSETRTKLGGLEKNTKYRVTIAALTSQGPGVPYFIEATTNNMQEPPAKPTFTWYLMPTAEGKASVKVVWLPDVDRHPGSHFFVHFRKKGETDWDKTDDEHLLDNQLVENLEPGTMYEMKVVAVDGEFFTSSDEEEIETIGVVYARNDLNNVATAGWFIGMMCAIAFLLLILLIVCLIKRNRGGKYSVHEKEAARGQEMEYPDDAGFNEYARPPGEKNNKGSRTSLSSSAKPVESDTDSMADYGEGETGKFTEDGSFIGQYGASKRKEREETSPGAMATFV